MGGRGAGQSRRNRVLAVVVAVVVLVVSVSVFFYLNRPAAQPAAGPGIVFVDGRYLPPPYSIKSTAAGIEVNGKLARAADAARPPSTPAPASPSTAPQVADVLASRLSQGNVIGDATMTPRGLHLTSA